MLEHLKLMQAFMNSNIPEMKRILYKTPELKNYKTRGFHPLIWYAARSGNIRITELLINNGFPFKKAYSTADTTPLFQAVLLNNYEMAEFLLKKGACPDGGIVYRGITPLKQATKNGFLGIMRLLVKYGADPTIFNLLNDAMNIMDKKPLKIARRRLMLSGKIDLSNYTRITKKKANRTIELVNMLLFKPWSPATHFFSSPKRRKEMETILHCINRTSYFKSRSKRTRPEITKVVLPKELWLFIMSLIPKEFSPCPCCIENAKFRYQV